MSKADLTWMTLCHCARETWKAWRKIGTRKKRRDATVQAPMAARVVLCMGAPSEKSSLAEESVRRWLPGRITESKACFARTPAPPNGPHEGRPVPLHVI